VGLTDGLHVWDRGKNISYVSVGIRTRHRPDRSLVSPEFGAVKD
jgi:hypothetical protein